jgi:hypothetical protein
MTNKKQVKSNRFDFNLDVNKGINKIKETTKDVNDFVLETSEDLVEGALKTSTEWTSVTEKALKGGLKLAETQQDLVFETLETLKGQLVEGRNRFKVLFTKN